MNYYLPETLEVGGVERRIRTDYRVMLDIFEALADPELSQQEKAFVAVAILYEDFNDLSVNDYDEAIRKCFWFMNGGQEEKKKNAPRLVDWAHDIQYIIPPINKACGQDVRGISMHWWTFLSYYMEIDSKCVFSTILSIRSKLKKGGVGKLDKAEKEWYYANKDMVDLPERLTDEEQELLKQWGI